MTQYFLCRKTDDGYEPVGDVEQTLAIKDQVCRSYARFTVEWLRHKPKLRELMMIGWAVNHLAANAITLEKNND